MNKIRCQLIKSILIHTDDTSFGEGFHYLLMIEQSDKLPTYLYLTDNIDINLEKNVIIVLEENKIIKRDSQYIISINDEIDINYQNYLEEEKLIC